MVKSLVSVIVPVYNMEAFLRETLDSVLASDYSFFEVIVMDDGSADHSYQIALEYAARDQRVKACTQSNAGVAAARNHAIARAAGEFILPVDADNRIAPTFIRRALEVFERDAEVRVVCPRAEFFGERSGEWKLAPFSLRLLARKNMMDVCALYRKCEWERVGGYCEDIIAREDWEFWIAVLKDGGKVVRLPDIELYYRIRGGSKRVTDRKLKKHVVDVLNRRHPEFFERELYGPLRYSRSHSRAINKVVRFFESCKWKVAGSYSGLADYIAALPAVFASGGKFIYEGRNELKEFTWKGREVVVKSYRVPHLLNRIVYRFFRASKAERSYRYADMLRRVGVGSPEPIGFYTTGSWFLLGHSYYACAKSVCPYTYRDFAQRSFARQDEILRAIARTTATLHEHGFLHKDYSAGNILFDESGDEIKVEIIDLNRMRFTEVSMEEGCKNFERLPGTKDMFRVLAEEYAQARGFDAGECLRLIEKYHE